MSVRNQGVVDKRHNPFLGRMGAIRLEGGEPFIDDIDGRPAPRRDIIDFISIAFDYLEKYPTDADALHAFEWDCGDDECAVCCERNRQSEIRHHIEFRQRFRRKEVIAGYVYLVQSPDTGLYKIGASTQPATRIKSIMKGGAKHAPVLIHTIKTDDQFALECDWHCRFADRNARGEWFNLSPEDVAEFCSHEEMEVAA